MRRRYRTKRRENRIGFKLTIVVACLLTVVVLVRGGDLERQRQSNGERKARLQAQITEEQHRAEDIAEFEKETHTRKYIEKVAREKLGLVYPGEIIFEKETY